MAKGKKPSSREKKTLTVQVSTPSRPDFDHPLVAYTFDATGDLLETTKVREGTLKLELSEKQVRRARIFLAPEAEELTDTELTPSRLQALGAFEPVLLPSPGAQPVETIEIPGSVLDLWPLCFCFVRGQVVRSSDGRPVCNARVHICEVDRLPWWIRRLPDPDILRLRDDLLEALQQPSIPIPPLLRPELPEPIPGFPEPGPDPVPSALPGPIPDPFSRPLIRVDTGMKGAPFMAKRAVSRVSALSTELAPEFRAGLTSPSTTIVRSALAEHWRLILPYLCLWPWWWRFRCDEVAVVTTDPNGRFQRIVAYPCGGDRPDLYFWVEYDLGAGFETVHRPPIACWTHWDYACGSEVTIRVSDARVPACGGEGTPPGKQVWVVSVGRRVSIGEIYTASDGPLEGMVREPFGGGQEDYAFGGKLEPRVWFGRSDLIAAGITHYLWSVRPLGGTGSEWSPLNRQVIRHYTTGAGTAPVEVMGPEPGGDNVGRFRIRPLDPPTGGIEWLVADEREDLAAAHLVTRAPPVPDPVPECGVPDPEAGKYEFKLELFDSDGDLVVWDDENIVLRTSVGEAPFGTDTVETVVAGDYHRIKDSAGKTVAFRMVLHVDNSRCAGVIDAVTGAGITVEPECGVVTLVGGSPTLNVGFHAGRPGGLARFRLDTERGLSTDIDEASVEAGVDEPTANGFALTAPCHFSKGGIPASTFLESCNQAAFSQHLRVRALSQNGYGRLGGLDAHDVAAFMLTEPCPPCPPCPGEEEPSNGQGPGGGQGQGSGQGQGRGRGGAPGQGNG